MTDTTDQMPPEAEEAEEEGPARLPYVVVRMSAAMKDAVNAYCKERGMVSPTLGRELLAERIGWDLSKDPDAPTPGTGTRQKYTDDAAREAGKLRNRKRSALLRKALGHVHHGTLKKKPLLVEAAQAAVITVADDKVTMADIEAADIALDAAIKLGK